MLEAVKNMLETPNEKDRIYKLATKLAKEDVLLEEHEDYYFVTGSELACYRIEFAFRDQNTYIKPGQDGMYTLKIWKEEDNED